MPDTSSRKVIEYTADIRDVRNKLAVLLRVQRQLAKNATGELAGGFKRVGNAIGKIDRTSGFKKTADGLQRVTTETNKTSQTIQGLDGKMVRVTTTTKKLANGTTSVSRSFQDVDKNTVSLGQNIARLAKRAILTIPVWFALRGAITGVFSTLRSGLKAIAEQDKAFQKAQRNISATASTQEELNGQMANLRKETLALSLQTGKSVAELTNAFQKFATVGFDAETSLAGMQYATKLATIEFGDAVDTANAFARSMRVLIDRSDGAKSEAEQLAEAMALTDELWQTNAFEIGEFTQSLEKFAGTAKTTNITTQETIALLATLSTAGLRQRGGRLLRTSIQKLLQNLDELATTVGVKVNPELDTTFGVLTKVIGELEKLQQTTGALGPATEIIAEIFGGARGAEVVRALIALRSELDKNINTLPDLNKFNKTFEDISQSTGVLTDRFHNANVEIGKALVTGLVGGDDFNDSLKRIVATLEEVRKNAQNVGIALRKYFGVDYIDFLGEQFKLLASGEIVDAFKNAGKESADRFGGPIFTTLRDIFQKNKEDLEETTDLTKKQVDLNKELTNELKEQEISSFKTAKGNKVLLDYTLERLKASGVLNSEIIKTENILKRQFGISDSYEDSLSRQLELQKSINDEKRLEANLSSTAVKLFNIAKDEGTDIAKRISEVLSGDIDFKTFIRRGGQAVEVFKKQFGDIFEQQQAKAFFSGEVVPDLKGLRGGAGITLPLEDEALQKSRSEIITKAKLEVNLAQRRLEIEQKINSLRTSAYQGLVTASRGQQVSNSNIGTISPEAMANYNRIRFGTPTPFKQTVQPSSVSFSPNITLSVNGQNAEDLNKRIDQTFELLKKQAKDEIKKQLTGNSNPNIPL